MATDIVVDFSGRWVLEETVDGEIPAPGIFFCIREGHLFGMPAIEVGSIGAKTRDLELEFAFADENDTEMGAHFVVAREEGGDFSGARGGSDVIVLWLKAEQGVPHAASGEQGLMASLSQAAGDGFGGLAE